MDPNTSERVYDVELQPGEPLTLPQDATSIIGPGHWILSIRPIQEPTAVRDHTALLNSYCSEDEGLYDDYSAR